jgi:hypothetical protein
MCHDDQWFLQNEGRLLMQVEQWQSSKLQSAVSLSGARLSKATSNAMTLKLWQYDRSMTGTWSANGKRQDDDRSGKKYSKNENIKKHWKKLHLFLHLSQWTLINSMVSLGKACQLQQDFVYEWQVAVCLMYPEVHDWKVAILKMCSLRPFIWHTMAYTKPVSLTIFRPAVLDSPRNLTIFIGMCFPFRNSSSARNQ